jgi:hypothetical protein
MTPQKLASLIGNTGKTLLTYAQIAEIFWYGTKDA